MRHRKDHRKLSRTAAHRRAVLRNLVTALFQFERIETTVAKAKEARRLAERLITFAKRGDLAARRRVGRFVTRPAVAIKLFDTVAPWYAERNGGYTRIVRLGPRLGDAGEPALVVQERLRNEEVEDRDALVRRVFLLPRACLHLLESRAHDHLYVLAAETARRAAANRATRSG